MSADARERDAEARRRAQREFAAPLLIEAGAGTGKTAVLVARVLAWAMGPGWERAAERLAARGVAAPAESRIAAEALSRVVAITFTESAAAEMAERVGRALRALQRGDEVVGVDPEALPADEALRRRRAGALEGVLEQLNVRTIHGFCLRLLKAYALDAGLHPGFEVDADGRTRAVVAEEVLDAWLREAWSEPPRADALQLVAADIGAPELSAALLELLAEDARPEDLDPEACGDAAWAALAGDLAAALEELVAADAGRIRSATALSKKSKLMDWAAASAAALRRSAPADGTALLAHVASLCDEVELPLDEHLKGLARQPLPKTVASAFDAADEARLRAAAGALRDLLRFTRELDPTVLATVRGVLARLLAECRSALHARGIVSYAGLLREASELMGRRPEVARRARAEIDQLLVDEFQDTDATQCELVVALALAGAPEERPGLFVVGDPKQSIYGWRSADLRAYHAFRAQLLAASPGGLGELAVSFRSPPPILDEVRRIVAPVMREEPGLQPPFADLLPCPELDGGTGFARDAWRPVEHWIPMPLDDDDSPRARARRRELSDSAARGVAADVARLREAGVPLRDVALLFRAHTALPAYLEALRRADIPYVVEREREYRRRREIADAAALARCALDPLDSLALVALLRASFVGVPDAALGPLWRRGLPDAVASLDGAAPRAPEALRALVRDAAAAVPDAVPGLERVAGWETALLDALDALAAARHALRHESAERFVAALRAGFLPEVAEAGRSLGEYRLSLLDRFFRELVEALEAADGVPASVAAELRRSGREAKGDEEGRPASFGGDAVRVLTIHKAKGLDFEHVYVLDTDATGRGREDGPETALGRVAGRREYRLAKCATPGYHRLQREREAVGARERVRLLYVAATRARQRLVLCGATKPPPAAPEHARSLAELLALREGGTAEGEQRCLAALAEHGELLRAHWEERDGVRFRLAPEEAPGASGREAGEDDGPRAEWAARDAQRLAAAHAAAAERERRPISRAASEAEAERAVRVAAAISFEAEEEEDEALDGERDADAAATPGGASPAAGVPDAAAAAARRRALAAGTAVHAALEVLDADLAPPEREARCRAALDAALAGTPPADRAAARERALAVWDALAAGPLLARLVALAPRVIARELPVLLAPGDAEGEPVGFWSGAIDLVYQEPDGAVVVVDYKTDALDGEAALAAAGARYAAQGEVYTRAVERALGLPARPRFELWFLSAGQVREVGPPPPAPPAEAAAPPA